MLDRLVAALTELPLLAERALTVLRSLPEEVQHDFAHDARFRIALETHVPGVGWTVMLDELGPIGSDSRCVVLRKRLATCAEEFAHYVIAHELAHAYLRNGGWGEIADHEAAADALAAHWGYRRPLGTFSRWWS